MLEMLLDITGQPENCEVKHAREQYGARLVRDGGLHQCLERRWPALEFFDVDLLEA
jgi:hypothetical protein